jgi:hypothetical protein
MVEAFGGSPRIHKGLVEGMLASGRVVDPCNVMEAEQRAVQDEVTNALKAALMISAANKARYGQIKEQLTNNYLLGTDQYPNTLEKATRILGNTGAQGHPSLESNRAMEEGFIQKGGWGAQGRGTERCAGNAALW